MEDSILEKAYPRWLNFKRPYQNEDGKWVCPYCGETFSDEDSAYPKLVMTFDSFQKDIVSYKDLVEVLELHWREIKGHACQAFTKEFWKRYEGYHLYLNASMIAFLDRDREREYVEKLIAKLKAEYAMEDFAKELENKLIARPSSMRQVSKVSTKRSPSKKGKPEKAKSLRSKIYTVIIGFVIAVLFYFILKYSRL